MLFRRDKESAPNPSPEPSRHHGKITFISNRVVLLDDSYCGNDKTEGVADALHFLVMIYSNKEYCFYKYNDKHDTRYKIQYLKVFIFLHYNN